MSRIGNSPIEINESVNVSINENVVSAKGNFGEMSCTIDPVILVEIKDNVICLSRNSEDKDVRSKHVRKYDYRISAQRTGEKSKPSSIVIKISLFFFGILKFSLNLAGSEKT